MYTATSRLNRGKAKKKRHSCADNLREKEGHWMPGEGTLCINH
jgi:hypothetical protein